MVRVQDEGGVDRLRVDQGLAETQKGQTEPVRGVTDFRRILEDRDIDAISVAAPNFWHAPATILACSAGKHVYVEKPGSHNPREAEWIVAAAAKHDRRVQMGNQRRSYPLVIEAMQRLREGVIGRVLSARCWYANARGSIGRGKPVPVPENLDYDLWQGPASKRPYRSNLIHYNWHWNWHYGGGEMANNGIHALDIARWGLGVDLPNRTTYGGGRYHHDDDQETPDTGEATFDFGHCAAIWSGSSCHPRKNDDLTFVEFFGEKGTLSTNEGNHYAVFDLAGKELEKKIGPRSDQFHFQNFLDSIRNGTPLNSRLNSYYNISSELQVAG